jgi:hypothetical protein
MIALLFLKTNLRRPGQRRKRGDFIASGGSFETNEAAAQAGDLSVA